MKKFFKIIKWVIVIALSIIILIEISLRFTCGKKLRRWSDFKYQPDTLLGYRYIPNSNGIFCNNVLQNNYFFNSLGFPGGEFSPNKRKEVYRIIIVGSSDDVGFNTNGPLNYFNIINNYFKINKNDAELINCSIDGSGKELPKMKFTKNECLRYQPDLVLFTGRFPFEDRFRYRTTYKDIRIEYESLNVNIDSVKTLIDKKICHKCFTLYFYDYSYIFRFVCKYYFDNKNNKDFKTNNKMPNWLYNYLINNEKILMGYGRGKVFWSVPKPNEKKKKKVETKFYTSEESLKLLKEVSSYLSDKKVKFVFLNKYKSSDKKDTYLNKLFEKYNVNYLPLNVQINDEYSFGEDDGHLSQEGHKAIASILYKVLIDSLIPKQYLINIH